jgi:hypothetical protein
MMKILLSGLVILLAIHFVTVYTQQTEVVTGFNLVCRDKWGTAIVRYTTTSKWSPEGVLQMNAPGESFNVVCGLE